MSNPQEKQHSTLLRKNAYRKSPFAQPFLKWAGGKRQLISTIEQYLPTRFTTYYEPFVGAGAVLFALQHKRCVINDANLELINSYRVIKEQPHELLALCKEYKQKNSKEFYYQVRGLDRAGSFKSLSPLERASRIIYLNKTCFNGLFRVNSSGQFNVPYGDYLNPRIVDEAVILAISAFLNQNEVKILSGDFADSVLGIRKGSFVYFDPPYHPISDTSSFTGYDMNRFGADEQRRLKELCDKLTDKGCKVLLSNSNASLIRELYSDSRYEIVEIQAARAINSVGSKRGKITELLIHNRYEFKDVGRKKQFGMGGPA